MYVCITVFTRMQILSTGSPKLYEKKKLYNISAELYRDILWTPEAFPGPNLRFRFYLGPKGPAGGG